MGKRRWTDADLVHAVESSTTITSVLRFLDLPLGGYNSKYIKKHINRLGLDISHFVGTRISGDKNSGSYRPLCLVVG